MLLNIVKCTQVLYGSFNMDSKLRFCAAFDFTINNNGVRSTSWSGIFVYTIQMFSSQCASKTSTAHLNAYFRYEFGMYSMLYFRCSLRKSKYFGTVIYYAAHLAKY